MPYFHYFSTSLWSLSLGTSKFRTDKNGMGWDVSDTEPKDQIIKNYDFICCSVWTWKLFGRLIQVG